jgi:hypothetical protein
MQNDSEQLSAEQAPATGPATVAEADQRLAALLSRTEAREAAKVIAADRQLDLEIDRRRSTEAIARYVEPLTRPVVVTELSLSQLRNIKTSLECQLRPLREALTCDLLPEDVARIKARLEKPTTALAKVDAEIAARGLDAEATPRPADPETAKPTPNHPPAPRISADICPVEAPSRMGDATILHNREWVTIKAAASYLGITVRAVQIAAKKGSLTVKGKPNRRISTESLLKYLPPEKTAK